MEIWLLLQILLIHENSMGSESVVWKLDCVICCFTIISERNRNPGQPARLSSAWANVVIEGNFLENKSVMYCDLSKRWKRVIFIINYVCVSAYLSALCPWDSRAPISKWKENSSPAHWTSHHSHSHSDSATGYMKKSWQPDCYEGLWLLHTEHW